MRRGGDLNREDVVEIVAAKVLPTDRFRDLTHRSRCAADLDVAAVEHDDDPADVLGLAGRRGADMGQNAWQTSNIGPGSRL